MCTFSFLFPLEIHIMINLYLSQLLLSMAYPKLNMHVVYAHHSYTVLVYFVYFLKHVHAHVMFKVTYIIH